FRGAREVPVELQTIKGPDRGADLVDDVVRQACGIGTEEGQRPRIVEAEDRVLVVTAVEVHAVRGLLTQRAPVADGEIDAAVSHRADVDDGRIPSSLGGRDGRGEQQVIRLTLV